MKKIESAKDSKIVSIEISNEELNQFESYLTVKLSEEQRDMYFKTCIGIWGKLVKEFDK